MLVNQDRSPPAWKLDLGPLKQTRLNHQNTGRTPSILQPSWALFYGSQHAHAPRRRMRQADIFPLGRPTPLFQPPFLFAFSFSPLITPASPLSQAPELQNNLESSGPGAYLSSTGPGAISLVDELVELAQTQTSEVPVNSVLWKVLANVRPGRAQISPFACSPYFQVSAKWVIHFPG